MKQIGSLLTAGALALSLVTLPAGAAEARASSTPCGRMGRSSSPATREIIPARRTAPSPMTFCTALAR